MRHILIFLFISTGLLAQTPRLNLKQLAKDTTFGSVLVSSPTDSGIVFSRDFYISYGADTVLILYGDTVGVGIDAEQVQDIVGIMANAGLGIDITYNDEDGELLFESLSIEDSVKNTTASSIPIGTPLYSTGAQGNYWTVAPADASDPSKLPVIAIAGETIDAGATGLGLIKGHIKGVNTSGFTAGDEVWLASGGGYTNIEPKGGGVYSQSLGTVIKVDANSGSGIINIQEPHQTLAPDHIFIGGADSLITSLNAKDTFVTVAETQTITGAKTFTSALTQSGGDVNFDSGTFFVDESTNKVGIGTSTPTSDLDIVGDGVNSVRLLVDGNGVERDGASAQMVLRKKAGYGFTVQIMSDSATASGVNVESNVSGANQMRLRTDSGLDGMNFVSGGSSKPIRFIQSNTPRLIVNSNGEILIGYESDEDNGAYKLQVENDAYIGGTISAGDVIDRSDIRLKENIYEYENGLNDIMQLNPVYYNLKETPQRQKIGFIAQDVRNVLPQAVSGNEQDGFLGISYSTFSAVLVKAIQEQQAIIDQQATEIDQLKTLITELNNRLTILENK